ncbi:hypothetical protein [Fructilactobacillus fructivorans]|uniref:Uncharacterized protein n=1 Tax=Fructilactobacillus fructivorans TaxID=1614 RepID=A0AAE6P3Q2_9LACO|nr:hypothetical protein [Fructilactobacillus fructivorans]KRK56896.1 hypothetical protein FC73_GL001288 [Fructilactobacillus fructivorans]KRN41240.1 hypothetical protein IV51_GL000559 [Fructilactobacillus fructivorans]KRN43055.1 hypothetical protein IV48_GL000862 [Fructilactobacillus fructivorans]QFX93248.1 hypothetical protein LF543_06735 [Fructilactobacillus fructivorans]RDV65068.1 hypothetical protein DXU76_03525 [Fructilactobacillus fructivorans]
MFEEVADSLYASNISSHTIFHDKWFIGSALQSIDYANLPRGTYYYQQPTIWTKVLKMKAINPYWEIQNDTENFLCINESKEKMSLVFSLFIEFYLTNNNFKLDSLVIFGDGVKQKLDLNNLTNVEELIRPFFISKQKVGNYMKVFQLNNGRAYPLFDCTFFKYNGKNYFEINVNQSYVTMVQKNYETIFDSKKYEKIKDSLFKIKHFDLVHDTRAIKLFAILKCLSFISDYDIKVKSSYLGHSVKSMSKELALQLFSLKVAPQKIEKFVNDDLYEEIVKEVNFIRNIKLDTLDKYDSFTLADRFGITDDIQRVLQGRNEYFRNYGIKDLRYFTDLPFCSGINSVDTLIKGVEMVNEGK